MYYSFLDISISEDILHVLSGCDQPGFANRTADNSTPDNSTPISENVMHEQGFLLFLNCFWYIVYINNHKGGFHCQWSLHVFFYC